MCQLRCQCTCCCVHAGLIFDESVGPDPTLEEARVKPKVTLKEDPKQAQVRTSVERCTIVKWYIGVNMCICVCFHVKCKANCLHMHVHTHTHTHTHTQMLQKLLSSKNPDDLRAANRLIRDMVRRDDKRMQKLQKRLEELELVQNNTKLLSELLAHYSPQSGEQEKSLIKVGGIVVPWSSVMFLSVGTTNLSVSGGCTSGRVILLF